MSRTPSQLSIDLIEAMVNDPKLPKKLREFQRGQLADLKSRRAAALVEKRPNPFSRFVDHLEKESP
jgi:hypothetical protein